MQNWHDWTCPYPVGMDWDGKVSAPQPVCAASGRTLEPGETVYSALVLHEGRFERRDIAAEAWAGWDQAQALSWWRRTVPAPQKRPERLRLDPQALLRIFADLADTIDPAQQRFRYIVALCLLRARKLVMDGIERTADGSVLVVHERGGASHRLPDPALKPEDEAQLTEQLMAVAGDQAAPLGTQEPA